MTYREFLERATVALAGIGARPLLLGNGGDAPAWAAGWDRILAAEGPGAATLYAFTDRAALSASRADPVEALARGLADRGVLSGQPVNLVVVAAVPSVDGSGRQMRRALAPRTYYPGLRPFAWLVDLSTGRVDAGRSLGQPEGRDLLADAAAGRAWEPAAAEELRDRHERQQSAFRGLMASRQPLVTYALIALNVGMFLLVYSSAGPYVDNLQRFGALVPDFVLHGQWWRLLSAMFLHGGLTHLFFNMTSLFVVGGLAERLYGSAKFLGIYLGSGLVASLAGLGYSLAMNDMTSPHVGASGAIFGIAGALMTIRFQHTEVVPLSLRRRVSSSMMVLVIINLVVLTFTPNIDNAAHIGGLIAGMALSFVFPLTKQLGGAAQWR